MSRFTIADIIDMGETEQLGASVADALRASDVQSVEVVLGNHGFEVRVWDEEREDGSNNLYSTPDEDYHC